jgi:hypothetical protein
VRWNTEYPKAAFAQVGVASTVVGTVVGVLLAVDLHDQPAE